MATHKLSKTTKPSLKNRTIADFVKELGEGFKEAVLNYPDCTKIYGEKLKSIKMPVSMESDLVVLAFAELLPELSDKALNLTDEEYESLFELIETKYKKEYPQHIGIWALLPSLIKKNPGKLYADTNELRIDIHRACVKVTKDAWDLQQPVRDEAINEFWTVATINQIDEIRDTARHRNNPQLAGMPGNGGIKMM